MYTDVCVILYYMLRNIHARINYTYITFVGCFQKIPTKGKTTVLTEVIR